MLEYWVGTSIAYETVGAPANPFVFSQRHKKVSTESVVTGVLKAGPSHVTEDNEESSQNTQGPSHLTISVNSENPELVCTVQEEDAQHEDENTPQHGNEEVEEQRTMPENQEIGEKESEELQSDQDESTESETWISCAGHLQYLKSQLRVSEEIANEIEPSENVNEEYFLIRIKEFTKQSNEDTALPLLDPGERSTNLTENQKKYLIRVGPHQPILQQYPSTTRVTNESHKHSRFNPAWFKEYPHLEYSLSKDAAFCFVCSLFGNSPGTEKADNAWVKEGVRSWDKFKSCGTKKQGKLAKHFSSQAHNSALLSYAHFAKTSGHIDVLLDKARRSALIQEEKDLQQNRRVIEILLDITKTLGRQEIAFRGHGSDDDGNFKQIDAPISRHVRLVSLTEAVDKTGEVGATEIIGSLTKQGLNLDELCFQSYDYTASMSGRFNGVQKNLQDKLGKSVPYIPCLAHRSNTVIEHSCKASPIITDLFNVLEALYVFYTGSTKRMSSLEDSIQSMKVDDPLNLRNLSRTRWTARAESIKSVWISYEAMLDSLSNLEQSDDGTASGLRSKLLRFDCIVSIMFTKNIMYKTKRMTATLQSEDLNVIDAITIVQSTVNNLQNVNDNIDGMNKEIQAAASFAEKHGVDVGSDFLRYHRQRKPSRRIDDNPNTTANLNVESFYRKEFKVLIYIKNYIEILLK
ncbi:zinc finger MYM-type 1-like [Paramuricea clavata]|uniref:Zinc finger MYM-type 1-like n=1 Tax=Paramuricea clavata TaxID=317549 RepID=A0A7D9D8Z0_PARCT|nr:zinc finger MYM-type 1-like [Paramuricea clavata]